MKEIGGYIELDSYDRLMLHEGAIGLNCGRNALALLLIKHCIKRIHVPYYLCESIFEICQKYNVEVNYYHVGERFIPELRGVSENDWILVVNYYGQLSQVYLKELIYKYHNIIVDNTQAYFQKPLEGAHTIYSCRKYFGVSDGAFLYTNTVLDEEIDTDQSYERIHYVLGRYERTATEFFSEASANNDFFKDEPIKRMSRLTENLLHAIDYEKIEKRRTENFTYLDEVLGKYNSLVLNIPSGAFMYPFMIQDAQDIKRKLVAKHIYIPVLWPNVIEELPHDWIEWKYARDILPLPVDQRYTINEMKYMVKCLIEAINH